MTEPPKLPRLTPPNLPPVPDATTTTTGTLVVKMTEPPKLPPVPDAPDFEDGEVKYADE
jgi:hypothetical protein